MRSSMPIVVRPATIADCDLLHRFSPHFEVERLAPSGFLFPAGGGAGQGGERPGDWEGERSIEFRVVCDEATAEQIADRVMARYAKDYSLVLYLADVQVRRAERFT